MRMLPTAGPKHRKRIFHPYGGSLALPEQQNEKWLMIIGVSRLGIPRIPVPEAKQKAGRMQTFTQHILFPARSCLGRIRQMAATTCSFALMGFITTPAQAASTVQFW